MMAEPLTSATRRWCLLAAFACALPLLALVPAWFAGVLVLVGVVAWFNDKPWPAWLRLVLTLALAALVLAAYGFRIGRDTSCAGLLAMLMLKPLETHGKRDAHSLLGFSLFAPFAAFLQDQGPLTIGLTLPATAISLLAWALLVPGRQRPFLPSLRQAVTALALAAPMALAGFWLFPRLVSPLWGLPENSVSRAGLGDRMTPNEWLDALVDDSAAFRVRFIGRTPPRTDMYWRGPVLTQFDGEAWIRDPAAQHTPPPTLLAESPAVRYELTLEPTERRDLLVLDLPAGAPAEGALNGELTAVTAEPINNLLRYRGQSHPRAKFQAPLGDWQRRGALSLPPGRNPRTIALARRWAAETPDALELTRRFTQLIQRDFTYSISVPPLGFHATDEFLFDTRSGFCQHFSSAYAVFMRAAGVPTRVVTGYVGGHYNAIGDYWLLKQKDAHAWDEIWIEGRGWLRVDPTAAVAPENILDTLDDLQARQQGGFAGGAAGVLGPVFDGSDFLRRQWNELVLGFNAARQQALLRPFGIDEAEGWQLVVAFVLGSVLAALVTFWFLLRQHRDRSHPMVRAWRDMTRRAGRAGWRKQASEPALRWARRVQDAVPAAADELVALSQRYCDWRYAGASLTDEEQTNLIRGLGGIRLPRRDRIPRTSP
jgi:protein-glutamine gamma-glutamyltransferase